MIEFIFRFLRSIKPTPLGRWCHNDKSKNNWKIDMANTDNCGTCLYTSIESLSKKEKSIIPKDISVKSKKI